jgi:hypothetical protein
MYKALIYRKTLTHRLIPIFVKLIHKICGSTLRLLNKKGLMAIRFRNLLGDRSYLGGALLLKFVCVLV